tara:strand:+ start:3201 stop:4649 length:1449 start_codon:yes stop_codon:yes gene_type:complete
MSSSIQYFKNWIAHAKLDLKSHQLDGIKWVFEREINPVHGFPGGFLCDDMGLGKTILMLGTIICNLRRRTLIVMPNALLDQWDDAIQKYLGDGIAPLIYHGATVKNFTTDQISQYPLVITTYGMIAKRKDPNYKSKLWGLEWDRIIYDEAHHVRNKKTRLFEGAMILKKKSKINWMVTGTPINNDKKDFYNLCVVQGMNKSFHMSADQISKVVRSCVMKRTKEQVGIKMPKLNEKVVEVEFETEKEEKFAKNIHNLMSFATVTSENVDEIISNMGTRIQCRFPIMMLMRQCCVYPKLSVRYFRKKYKNECKRLGMKKNFHDIGHSKLNAVVNKVIENKGNGKKKLIFCLFTKEIELLKKLIEKAGISAETVYGSTPKKLRKERLRTPEKEEDGPEVLIVQIQTACEGLNLQHINEVYFTTPHWNPSVEEQAIARAHRIGQKKAVDVYRFVSKFQKDDSSITLDEYCMTVQEKKREIAKSIFT